MITNTIDSLTRARAERAREIEYLREIAKDDVIDNRLNIAESMYVRETTEDYLEAAELVDSISEDDSGLRDVELNRILNAKGDITFNEMAGIEDLSGML